MARRDPLARATGNGARKRLIADLRAATRLDGGALDRLVADLASALAVYSDHASTKRTEQVAEWYASVADHWERLVELAETAPANISLFSVGLDPRELGHRALGARADAQLHALNNPKHRPPWRGMCRDYLARKAKEIIVRYCGSLTEPNLRRAVAAVLDEAGGHYPNPKKDPAKFDKMFVEPSPPSDDELQARAAVIAERIGDQLI